MSHDIITEKMRKSFKGNAGKDAFFFSRAARLFILFKLYLLKTDIWNTVTKSNLFEMPVY